MEPNRQPRLNFHLIIATELRRNFTDAGRGFSSDFVRSLFSDSRMRYCESARGGQHSTELTWALPISSGPKFEVREFLFWAGIIVVVCLIAWVVMLSH